MRDIAADNQRGTGKIGMTQLQVFYHTAHIVSPTVLRMRDNWFIQREYILLIVIVSRNNMYLAIIAFTATDDGFIINGAGQHKAIVIIGMLADKIDAARSFDSDVRFMAKLLAENGLGMLF
ncbi:Uncharacterised protein [Yersinia enterocolitica]|nr:Uncharacterised protein [Yersinia enterocolitica]